ncbi:protein of unknown function [Candidatus Nitrospira inopinata]|uniref:Uncharacterized protein n=1 Tax=Candidatus Nitrospira inopinata TaxID=1715989 RepID=A0A0S4KTM0_9BACT|nr:protein of unknown function [Candidatus Nitrospira inopinata]
MERPWGLMRDRWGEAVDHSPMTVVHGMMAEREGFEPSVEVFAPTTV